MTDSTGFMFEKSGARYEKAGKIQNRQIQDDRKWGI
jgi:hypothetical protein